MSAVIILQSGYAASPSPELKLDTGINDNVAEIARTGTIVTQSPNSGYYHEVITKLYSDYVHDLRKISDMDFREEILIEAKKVFSNFGSFAMNQAYSPYISPAYVNFLKDTFNNYLSNGKRESNIQTWFTVIGKRTEFQANRKNQEEINSSFDKFITNNYFTNDNCSRTARLLQIWTRQEEGFADLLTTLFIIFGKRT